MVEVCGHGSRGREMERAKASSNSIIGALEICGFRNAAGLRSSRRMKQNFVQAGVFSMLPAMHIIENLIIEHVQEDNWIADIGPDLEHF